MPAPNILSDKDVNTGITVSAVPIADAKPNVKSMEYHRQVLERKMELEKYNISNSQPNPTQEDQEEKEKVAPIPSNSAPVGGTEQATPYLSPVYRDDGDMKILKQKAVANKLLHQSANLAVESDRAGVQTISPSDHIQSPCTQKLNALKGRQAGKAKPKSLFAQTSAKKLAGDNLFGANSKDAPTSNGNSRFGN
ncbi:hypothetical protein F4778DRAFT_12440 [Xylariomycetidae sp. FL2044]|nr:hypothetical protein F4778DRAFT_12440 [Xylariomycetidae sp. FL2044]